MLALACAALVACSAPRIASQPSPAAVNTRDPGRVGCPDGKPARSGLQNFGAYVGTWQANHLQAASSPPSYAIGSIAGLVQIRCSTDDFVIAEAIYPRNQSPAGQALRVGLTDLPDDSVKVYDHAHAGCRTLQYQSKKLAQQLGPDDRDGRVNIVLVSQTATYNAASIHVIYLDVLDKLGEDSDGC
jgi:hypothetical protein